ncbi:MAG: ROK family protein, partial [Oscillospiraceae bacterium]|nr:ROK family protein [Oscillospiraceae bacterium]
MNLQVFGIPVEVAHSPELDPGFIPMHLFNEAFLKSAKRPIGIAVERAGGEMASCPTFIHGTPDMLEADRYYIRRLVKTVLWMKGGFRVYCDDEEMFRYLRDEAFCDGGIQDFDFHYFSNIFERPFEVVLTKQIPAGKDSPIPMGGHLEGCRIGFDAGGSDRKVSAVIDGETVYSEEVVWFPKINSDPDYHYDGIVSALKSAAAHMPRVDAVGVSSAGVYIKDRTMSASLFLAVPKELYD